MSVFSIDPCYIDQSFPAVLYLAARTGWPEAALVANTNAGGDNGYRGEAPAPTAMMVDLDQAGAFELLYKKITPWSKLFIRLLYKSYNSCYYPMILSSNRRDTS